ncbi:hypothetical protein TSUD_36050 [Trifolium subterraneum]|uniref:Coenzyme Q-binding protein COQ10 START domain-containing protein n=1 Tax=Trifolium subterraneum TaxID=3900 RepID=A0A2Z6N6R6_TRISU|nr:hypothetical protein TSUD_36050 [Trifolium subterraneum]
MEWQDCTVKREVDVPVSVAYACYSDREAISEWMPFISTVKPTPNQKIHWRSLEGLPNSSTIWRHLTCKTKKKVSHTFLH